MPGLRDAKAGLSEARYGRLVGEGQRALALRRRAEAIRAFEAAARERPLDPVAEVMLLQARALRN
jgi:hypothetical protein